MAEELEVSVRANAKALRQAAAEVSRQLSADSETISHIQHVKLPLAENELRKSEYFTQSLQTLTGWLKNLFWRPHLQKTKAAPPAPTPSTTDSPEEDDLLHDCTAAAAIIDANLRAITAQTQTLATLTPRLAALNGRVRATGTSLKEI